MGEGSQPLRTLAESIIRLAALQAHHPEEFPTFHQLAREIPAEEWMYHRAVNIP